MWNIFYYFILPFIEEERECMRKHSIEMVIFRELWNILYYHLIRILQEFHRIDKAILNLTNEKNQFSLIHLKRCRFPMPFKMDQ